MDEAPLNGVAANVLILLALAPDRRLPAHQLRQAWPLNRAPDDNAMQQVISKLRRKITVPPKDGQYYRLELEPEQLDADVFVDGVDQLSEDPAQAEVDRLLSMWHGDPVRLHPATTSQWHRVIAARHELLQAIATMPVDRRRTLTALPSFLSLFPAGDLPGPLRAALAATGRSLGRERLLIVEDQMGDTLAQMLCRDYDCVIVTSLDQWRQRVATDDLDFDAALVDLHLTGEREDAQGVEVMEHLRDHTRVPTMLISGAPQPGDTEAVKRRYALSGVFLKGPGNSLPNLRASVARVIREGRPGRPR